MSPGDFRFYDPKAVDQFARILREAIERAKREQSRRGGQHSTPRLLSDATAYFDREAA